jgi:hypothetical protein
MATIEEVLADLEGANASLMDAIVALRGASANLEEMGGQTAAMDNTEQAAAIAEAQEQVDLKAVLFSAQRHELVSLSAAVAALRTVTG